MKNEQPEGNKPEQGEVKPDPAQVMRDVIKAMWTDPTPSETSELKEGEEKTEIPFEKPRPVDPFFQAFLEDGIITSATVNKEKRQAEFVIEVPEKMQAFYTEEDMRKCWSAGIQRREAYYADKTYGVPNIDEYLQSVKPAIINKEKRERRGRKK